MFLHLRCLVSAPRVAATIVLVAGMSGCSSFQVPSLPFGGPSEPEYVSGDGMPLRPSDSTLLYQKVRQAKSQNSIVLQIHGAEPPLRILPLPPNGQSVFVSDLLSQTGVLEKLGQIEATLYRDAPGSPGGVRMLVKMSPDQEQVRPESDYALQAGDRLMVQKARTSKLPGIVQAALGL